MKSQLGGRREATVFLTAAVRVTLLAVLLAACAARTSGGGAQHPQAKTGGDRREGKRSEDAASPTGGTLATLDAGPAPPLAPAVASDAAGAFMGALEKASPAGRELAKSSGQDAAEKASIVLYSIADAIESIPGASNRVPAQLTEVRFEAKRLHRSDRLSFSLAHWIKEGLTAALAALESLIRQSDPSAFWIAQARSSITAIDAKSGLTFQRAVVQDAVRATLDAFIAVGQRMSDSH